MSYIKYLKSLDDQYTRVAAILGSIVAARCIHESRSIELNEEPYVIDRIYRVLNYDKMVNPKYVSTSPDIYTVISSPRTMCIYFDINEMYEAENSTKPIPPYYFRVDDTYTRRRKICVECE